MGLKMRGNTTAKMWMVRGEGGNLHEAFRERGVAADRASIPLEIWTLDHVVRALIEHYDATDAETNESFR